MTRRLDIGICAYGSPDLLRRAIESVRQHSVTDWRLIIVSNEHPVQGHAAVEQLSGTGLLDRASLATMPNAGYAGAVKYIQTVAQTEYIAYLDHDTEINTPGWDETLCSFLDRRHEVGMVFPNGGAYPIDRGDYHEVMWAPGFVWVLNRLCMSEVGYFDDSIGHQNECDYALRVRMAGWRCATLPQVQVAHAAQATNDPSGSERIAKGVKEFVDKWCEYFCGRNVNYNSPNVLRWEDWPPNALYLEEYWKLRRHDLNAIPETTEIDGREYDLIRVPRLKDFYRNRII